MLKDLVKKDYISVGKKADDWRAAIRVSGRKLLEDGAIEESYIDGMIDAVVELGPYIAIAPQIAIAHAKPDCGVNRTSMAITTLAEPVPFGHKDNDPIKLIITLAAENHDAHIDALAELMDVLAVRSDDIINAGSEDDLYALLG